MKPVFRKAVTVSDSMEVLYQKKLESSIGSSRTCVAIHVGAVPAKNGGNGENVVQRFGKASQRVLLHTEF